MIERLVDLFFTLEAPGKNRVGFDFGIGDNECHGPICKHIGSPERGGGAARGDHILNTVVVQLIADTDRLSLRIVYMSHPSPRSTLRPATPDAIQALCAFARAAAQIQILVKPP